MTILNGVTATIRKAAITTVIGPNGAGKSTMFKAIFGLLPVRSGRIMLDGAETTNLRAAQMLARGRLLHPARAQHLPRAVGEAQSGTRRRRAARWLPADAAASTA